MGEGGAAARTPGSGGNLAGGWGGGGEERRRRWRARLRGSRGEGLERGSPRVSRAGEDTSSVRRTVLYHRRVGDFFFLQFDPLRKPVFIDRPF